MRRISIDKGVFLLGALLAALQAIRGFAQDTRVRDVSARMQKGVSLGELQTRLQPAWRWAPEDPRANLLWGEMLFSAHLRDPSPGGAALGPMAMRAFGNVLLQNPCDGRAPLYSAILAKRAGKKDHAMSMIGIARRNLPVQVEPHWAYARFVTGAGAKTAYRRISELAPELTPRIVAEVAPYATTLTQQADFVAQTQASYRAWAWSVTGPEAEWIAREGLRMNEPSAEARGVATGWLTYLVGLRVLARDPAAAAPWLESAAQALPNEAAVLRNLGFARLRSGSAAGARAAFEASLALDGDIANAAHTGLAQVAESEGDWEAAERIYRRLSGNPRVDAWSRDVAGRALARPRL